MGIERTELVRLLEEALFLMPTARDDIGELAIPDVRGRITPTSHPMANLVGSVPRTKGLSDATIQEVVECFRSQNKAFGWVTGPLSPEGLERQLIANRLAKIDEFSGMVLTDLAKPIVTRPGVRVVEVPVEERERFQTLLSMAFQLPPDVAAFMSDVLYFNPSHLKVRNYFAFLAGVDEPVGLGSTMYMPESSVVLLAGSATLPEYRHRGVYRGLVARRVDDARNDDQAAALIQAARTTSAPICKKMGFAEVCRQALYMWEPDVPA